MKQYEVDSTVSINFMGTALQGKVIDQCPAYVRIFVTHSSNPRLIEIGQTMLVRPEEILDTTPLINPRDHRGISYYVGAILYLRSFERDLFYEVIDLPYKPKNTSEDCWALPVYDMDKGDEFDLYFAPDNSTLVCNPGVLQYDVLRVEPEFHIFGGSTFTDDELERGDIAYDANR